LAQTSWREIEVSGFVRIVLVGAVVAAGLGIAGLRAQTVLGDPRDAARTFASNCSTCHKSPQGLAKSGQVAGFLRQHYTTGPEMSAAMAAYLVAAGNAPASRKGAATAAAGDGAAAATAAKSKGKKGDQLAAHPATASDPTHQRTLRGKQRPTKQEKQEEDAATHQPAPATQQPATPAPAVEETKQAAVSTPAASSTSATSTAPTPAAATPAAPALVVLDIPLPALPDAPPPELTQSVFASSPLP
jgi:hypothetical protein